MSTLNGIGTRFLDFSKLDEEGCCYTTKWFTIFYLPIIPIERIKIKRDATNTYNFKYYVIERGIPPGGKNILLTYLNGWILYPLFIFTPGVLCIHEVAHAIGVPHTTDEDMGQAFDTFGLYQAMMAFALVWVLVVIWKLKDWDEARGLPASMKRGRRKKNEKAENPKTVE